jgi:anaerobic selenocysteine-containing dehydrogenase
MTTDYQSFGWSQGGASVADSKDPQGRAARLHGYCGLCIARCGYVAEIKDGNFVALHPDPAHPTGQALCAKGRAAPELVYHSDRLTHPLKRTQPKGNPDPGWHRITWNDALELTAAAMRRIADRDGPQAFAFSLASPSTTAIADSAGWIRRLMNAFGTPNASTNVELCGWGRSFATRYTYGVGSVASGIGGAMADIPNSGCVILWGYNPSVARLTHATMIVEAIKRGLRLVVVDPRQAGLANKADVWLRPRPGSDGALALGLANLMIERNWYDDDFVRNWSNGPLLVRADTGRFLTEHDLSAGGSGRRYFAWDSNKGDLVLYDSETSRFEPNSSSLALAGEYRITTAQGSVLCRPVFELYAALCRRYSPDVIKEICWIDPEQLEEAARIIWHARPTSYYAWSGHEQHTNTTQTARAISIVYALTGCFDVRGGNVILPSVPVNSITGEDLANARRLPPALGLAERPLGPARWNFVTGRELYEAILHHQPYPVRGLLGFGANLLLAHADVQLGRKALAALEFYAHADLFMNPTAEMADVVLPVASPFECEALKIGFDVSVEAQSLVQLRQPVVPPRGECRSDMQIVFDLACRLGLGDSFWHGDIEAAYKHQLAPSGVTSQELRAAPGGVRVALKPRYAKHASLDANGTSAGFSTPSRKVEIYSQIFLEHGYTPLPDFQEPLISPRARPDLAVRYPLILTSTKHTLFCESQHRGLPSLRKHAVHPEVELNPETARVRDIAAGDWVVIETPQGSVRARARFNDSLDSRVVCGQHGWWQACKELGAPGYNPFGPDGANLNLVISGDARDPISGTVPHRAYLCEIRRASSGTFEAKTPLLAAPTR